MKRLVPLWICAVGGFVLIVAYFIPATQGWGEVAAIWFDILAAIAFILGGGNLIMVHLKKASDRAAGWGYSVLTVASFLLMLWVGLFKVGGPPAPNQEYYGESFVSLPLDAMPAEFTIDGTIPEKAHGERLHYLVSSQVSDDGSEITFRGWMRKDQMTKLLAWDDSLEWQCTVTNLFQLAQPPESLKGKLAYYADHNALSFGGTMSEAQRKDLVALNGDDRWQTAVEELYNVTRENSSVEVASLPDAVDPASFPPAVSYDEAAGTLSVTGTLTKAQRGALTSVFPVARPLDPAQREELLARLQAEGPLEPKQIEAFNKVLDGSWTPAQMRVMLDAAGKVPEVDRTACEMLEDQRNGIDPIPLKKTLGGDVKLNPSQVGSLQAFVDDPDMTVDELVTRLAGQGDWVAAQEDALVALMGASPTVGERNKVLAIAMMQAIDDDDDTLPLTAEQRKILLDDYAAQTQWKQTVGELYVGAHKEKYKWSGEYRAQGSPFWWLYEYVFKPLQATIFAMLAFYVASAAFRAFRAKNIEAILLLGTAFIILLGRTYAGVVLTGWLPDAISGLKIENLTVYIMQVFNTAGNRAIMIGIALGITSTSLKVLLGVDRSYLGSGEE